MNIKKLSLAVAGALLVVGCASNNGIVKNADLKPDSDSIRPKPVSTVFHRPEGAMTITFSPDGKFLEITSKGTAPIAGNNAFSIEDAAQVAQLRAKKNIAEFISTQLNTTRSLKVLSTTVQKSLENTTNGMAEEVKVDDKDFSKIQKTDDPDEYPNFRKVYLKVKGVLQGDSYTIETPIDIVVNQPILADSVEIIQYSISLEYSLPKFKKPKKK